MKLLAISLLLAQVWVSPHEQSYGPYLAPANGAEPAVVAAQDRVLLAWSELDPLTKRASIRTGVLDFNGRLVSEIRTLPAFQAAAEATMPSVATDGETFAVFTLETLSRTRMAMTILDRDGVPVAPPQSFDGYYYPSDVELLSPVMWNGRAYEVAMRKRVSGDMRTVSFAFDREGKPTWPSIALPVRPRYAAGDEVVGMSWMSTPREYRCGWGVGHGCNWFDPEFRVEWEFRPGQIGSKSYVHYSESRAVTAGDDETMAVAWRAPDGLMGLRVIDRAYDSTFRIADSGTVREPDAIAFDGEQWLLVYTRQGDVWGAFIDRASKELTPFPIAVSNRAESKAQVTTLAPGRFLVSYSSDLGPGDHRFAGRVVMTERPVKRRRAVN